MRPEDKLLQQISNYLQLQYPDVIFHFDVGSGSNKSIGMAMRDKRLNPQSGFPDLFIAEGVPDLEQYDGLCRGLFIELKAEGKSPYLKDGKTLRKDKHIEKQAKMLKMLQARGYKAVFATGFEESKRIIDDYLK